MVSDWSTHYNTIHLYSVSCRPFAFFESSLLCAGSSYCRHGRQSNRDWRDCKAIELLFFKSPFSPWSIRADGDMPISVPSLPGRATLSPESCIPGVEPSVTFTASNCQHQELVKGQLHREFRSSIQHCAQAAVESTWWWALEHRLKYCEMPWNAYLSCYVIVHSLFANHIARAYYKMIHGNPHAMWTFARTEKVSFWVNCSRMHSLATHIWNTCLMPKVAPLQSRHLNVPLVFADVQLTRCRLETNKLRNIGKFFAHLLYTDWRYWSCWVKHKTTLSPDKDLFLKWVSCCWICWTFWALSISPAIPHQTAWVLHI